MFIYDHAVKYGLPSMVVNDSPVEQPFVIIK